MLLERLEYCKTSFWQVLGLEDSLCVCLYSDINLDNMQKDTCSERRGQRFHCGPGFWRLLFYFLSWSPRGATEVTAKGRNTCFILADDAFWFPEAAWLSSTCRKYLSMSRYMQKSPSCCCSQLWLKSAGSQGFVTGVLGTLFCTHGECHMWEHGTAPSIPSLSSLLYPCRSAAEVIYPKIISSVLNEKTMQQSAQPHSIFCLTGEKKTRGSVCSAW